MLQNHRTWAIVIFLTGMSMFAACEEEDDEPAMDCCIDVTNVLMGTVCSCDLALDEMGEDADLVCPWDQSYAVDTCEHGNAQDVKISDGDCDDCLDAVEAFTVDDCENGETVGSSSCNWYSNMFD